MSTTKEDLEGAKGEELKNIQERLAIKRRILTDPNAMAFVIHDAWMYAFLLARQSLKRQSRKEAMNITMSPRPITPATEVGRLDKLFTKLGVSRKYKDIPVER